MGYHRLMAMQLRTTDASETYTALWTTLSRLREVLAREMEDETGLPFEHYLILLTLARADDETLRPSELADILPITRSGVTRLIDRLERDGIVERRSCATDGRGRVIGLTPAGQDVFREAGRMHLRGLDHHIGSHLTVDEMTELRRLTTKLATGIEAANGQTRVEVTA